ncbi:MAG: chemotaxis protein CheC [Firmicutes bacterium]|nr:chemotaxis protein CheC [Bacillota bacterium]
MRRAKTGNILYKAIAGGIGEARQVIELMVSVKVSTSSDLRPVDISKIPSLMGPLDRTVVATYSRVAGDIDGHLAFLYEPGAAETLAALVTGQDRPDPELGASALCEVSNVAGSRILNFLSDASGLRILPTPPILVSDMAGAILQSVLYDLAPFGNEAMVLKTDIRLQERGVMGMMVLIPSKDSLARLLDGLGRQQ